jgi:hypothetical protein
MRLLDGFIDSLKNSPAISYPGYQAANGRGSYVVSPRENIVATKLKILSFMSELNVFILSDEFIDKFRDSLPDGNSVEIDEKVIDLDVAVPLKTCWFQFPERSTLEGSGMRGIPVVLENGQEATLHGMFLHEIAPKKYYFSIVASDAHHSSLGMLRYRYGKIDLNKDDNEQSGIWNLISVFLQPFAKNYTGASLKVPDRIKYKDPTTGEKILKKLRRVIMVYPDKITALTKALAESEGVDFSHRFNIRAHWRRLLSKTTGEIDPTRIGKNRDGEYIVPGYTYVEEGEKGEEHLPLILKTRIVKTQRTSASDTVPSDNYVSQD